MRMSSSVPLMPKSGMFSAALKRQLHFGPSSGVAELNVSQFELADDEFISKLLNRRWALSNPETQIHQIMIQREMKLQLESGTLGNLSLKINPQPSLGNGIMDRNDLPSFYVVRDDLLHPLVNGNKSRKLDALLPLLQDMSVTDVVTCGGCQSANAAAVAVLCAERGLKSHLLLRGEQPETLTGYNLISTLYGNVSYVPRSLYARREEMLSRHADSLAGNCGTILWANNFLETSFINHALEKELPQDAHRGKENSRRIAVINEGAGDAVALLGIIRLVRHLSERHLFGKRDLKIIVDAGTGTTAVGLGLAALCLRLPWEVTAVMLADTIEGYKKKEACLVSEFRRNCNSPVAGLILERANKGIVNWVERSSPRRFGNVIEGEVEECQRIAQQTGILVDPIYTLAAWDLATRLSLEEVEGAKVVMLHTGGTLGMFGLAQRYKPYFQTLKDKSWS